MESGWAGWQDAELARAARADGEAFAELYRRHVPAVYRYLLSRTGSVASAEDITASAFTAALAHIANYRGDGAFIGWLMAIARAQANEFHRQRYRAEQVEQPLADHDDLPDDAALDEIVLARLEWSSVTDALERLSPERAEVIRLRLIADLSTAETARLMDKSDAAVKMLLHRALSDLRSALVIPEATEPEKPE